LEYFAVIWNILQSFGIFCSHLEYFEVIWNILQSFGIFNGHFAMWSFGIFSLFLVHCVKKNLATLRRTFCSEETAVLPIS
jgi:hypothetical protein